MYSYDDDGDPTEFAMWSTRSKHVDPDIGWQLLGACVGEPVRLFFPERGADANTAKSICATCGVRDQCLEYSLTNGIRYGIWGGLSERQRKVIRAARARGEAA